MTHILIVEDDIDIRSDIAEILGYEGFTVTTAANGIQGVEKALQSLPDLILCDVMMPDMDGFAVLDTLRAQPATKAIPFIFLTARTDRDSIRHGMNLGADDYLTKPCTSEELLAAVNTRLEKWAAMEHMYQQSFEELRANLLLMLPHELRTPLVGILGYGELMRMDYENLGKEDILQMGEIIVQEGERLQRVVENYFLYAQLELARYNDKARQSFAQGFIETPGTLIADTAKANASKAGRDSDLIVQIEDTPLSIAPQSLWKIVEELVNNAFKFSTAGTPVEIRAGDDGRRYRLQISDHGRGMTLEQIKRVGAYVQFERRVYEQQGLGLGLVLAQRLAEVCGGDLTINSQPEQGTTVTVTLPISP
ncbi:MAG TPA: response regulator [Phototrophicaceae bacterium]|nr:response regulator [Phototrophicaceae bacterium]